MEQEQRPRIRWEALEDLVAGAIAMIWLLTFLPALTLAVYCFDPARPTWRQAFRIADGVFPQ